MLVDTNNVYATIHKYLSWEACQIFDKIIDRIQFDEIHDIDDLEKEIQTAMDDELIWTADQWTLLAEFIGNPEHLSEDAWQGCLMWVYEQIYEAIQDSVLEE